ncbi:MAG: glycosyltransferase family 9 protein, partial [Bdellovibrionales bacterium]|nr:glycosyltransferase family 9 protein [Bdellovibrionales bacterium]
ADLEYANSLIGAAEFSNQGPLVVLQAGASQGKRQWAPAKFVRLIDILTQEHNCRVVLSGTKKELSIIEPIYQACKQENVFIAAGKTNIPQLSALLKISDILVTGDTGPMHMAVAVGTPVVSMFLASAFGFETGPYSEGNIILQPVLECGPCNPNKGCARPDCHDLISPELMAQLTTLRLKEDFRQLPQDLQNLKGVQIYRSYFDQWGFCDLESLTTSYKDWYAPFRDAYRKLWLDDLGGFLEAPTHESKSSMLKTVVGELEGLDAIVQGAEKGLNAIAELQRLIADVSSPPARLGEISEELTRIDRHIEQVGYYFPYLGPLARMFLFAKENISGTDADVLASQMETIYEALRRRALKFRHYMGQS